MNKPQSGRVEMLINNNNIQTPKQNLISLSKSKEYAKLANQIPTILTVENG